MAGSFKMYFINIGTLTIWFWMSTGEVYKPVRTKNKKAKLKIEILLARDVKSD